MNQTIRFEGNVKKLLKFGEAYEGHQGKIYTDRTVYTLKPCHKALVIHQIN
jgi:hypothetical protein